MAKNESAELRFQTLGKGVREGGPPQVMEGDEVRGGDIPEVREGGPPDIREWGPPEVKLSKVRKA